MKSIGGSWELTPSQRAVVALVAEGLSNREIAACLHLSPRTVQRHLYDVFRKVGVSSRADLAREAARRGVVNEQDRRGHSTSVVDRTLVFVVIAFALLTLVAPVPVRAQANLRVGVADREMTWHVDAAGFSGVHSHQRARAIVVEGPEETFAIARADLLMITSAMYESVTQRVVAATGIAPENVLLAATHTHHAHQGASPHVVQSAYTRSFDPHETEFIAKRIAEAIQAAAKDLRPATFAAGSGSVSLPTFSRRSFDGAAPANDPSRLDPELGVLRFDDAATGEPLAIVMNHALHPVVLTGDPGYQQPLSTADFVVFAETMMTQSMVSDGDGPMTLWLNGALGDQIPIYVSGTYADAEWTGRVLADEALRVARELQPEPLLDASMVDKLIPVPRPGSPDPSDGPGMSIAPGGAAFTIPSSVRLQAVAFETRSSETILLSWPGEPIKDIGVDLKQEARAIGFENAYVVGLANDWAGYWLTPTQFDKGGYERLLAFYGRESQPYISHHLLDLARNVEDPQRIEQVSLPPQAEADRAVIAAMAFASIQEGSDAFARPGVADVRGIEAMAEPEDLVTGDVTSFTWRGGSPNVSQQWVPRVSIQRRTSAPQANANGHPNDEWETVAREGTGELLLYLDQNVPGDVRWKAVWQAPLEAKKGLYRFFVEGRRRDSPITDVAYDVTSESFVLQPCACIVPEELNVTHDPDGAVLIRVRATYDFPSYDLPALDFRLLPKRVTTGTATVEVVRDGEVLETLELTFVSKEETETRWVAPIGYGWTVCTLQPVDNGAFEGTWIGDATVSFRLAGIEDAFGNRSIQSSSKTENEEGSTECTQT